VYCEDCDIAERATEGSDPNGGVQPWAVDHEAADRLWDLTETMLASA
jgi:hypothetical protein